MRYIPILISIFISSPLIATANSHPATREDAAPLDLQYFVPRYSSPSQHDIDEKILGTILPRMIRDEKGQINAERELQNAEMAAEAADHARKEALKRMRQHGVDTRASRRIKQKYDSASNKQMDAVISAENWRVDVIEQQERQRGRSSRSSDSVHPPQSSSSTARAKEPLGEQNLPQTPQSRKRPTGRTGARGLQSRRRTRQQPSRGRELGVVSPFQGASKDYGQGDSGKQSAKGGGKRPDMRKGTNIERSQKAVEWNKQNPGAEIAPSSMGRPVGSTGKRKRMRKANPS